MTANSYPILTPRQRATGMNNSIFVASFINAFTVITAGVFLTGFILKLGGSKFQIGALTALCTLFALMSQTPGAYLVEKGIHRKKIVVLAVGIQMMLWWFIVGLPHFAPESKQGALIWGVITIVAISHLLGCLGTAPWYSWLSDLVPEKTRGRFFGRMNMATGLTGIIISLAIGRYLDRFSNVNGFTTAFAGGIILGLFSLLALKKMPEPPSKKSKGLVSFSSLIKIPFRNLNFKKFVLFRVSLSFAQGILVPFVAVFMIENLKISYSLIAIFIVIASLANALSMKFWGYLADKFGNKSILSISTWGMAFLPILWLFNRTDHIAIIPFLYFFGGIFGAGAILSNLNLLLKLSPEDKRPSYIAAANVAVGISTAIAAITGGFMAQRLGGLNIPFLHLNILSIHSVFIASTILYIFPLYFLRRVVEHGEKTAGYLIKQIRTLQPFRVVVNLTLLSQNLSEKRRAKAVKALGEAKSRLAVDRLIEALSDPNLEVRQEAAWALGRIGDLQSVEVLLEKLRDKNTKVQPQTAWALGEIGSKKAVPHLIENLSSSDIYFKSSVIRALGKIGDREAIEPLGKLLKESGEEIIIADAAWALSKLGSHQALEDMLRVYAKMKCSTAASEVLIAMGDLLGKPGRFYLSLSEERKIPGLEVKHLIKGIRTNAKNLPREQRSELENLTQSLLSVYEEEDYRLALLKENQICRMIAGSVAEKKAESKQLKINLEFIDSLTSIEIRDKMKEQVFLAVFALAEITKWLRK